MNLFLAYVFYFVAASASPLYRRWSAKKQPDDGNKLKAAFYSNAVLACMAPLLFIHGSLPAHIPVIKIIILAVLAGVFGTAFIAFQYNAQKHVDAGLTTVISNIYTPVVIILSTLFLGEKLKGLQFVGTGLLLYAAIIMSKKHKISRFKYDTYFMQMLCSGMFLGVTLIIERLMIKSVGLPLAFTLSWLTQTAGIGLVSLSDKRPLGVPRRVIGTTGVLRFFQIYAFGLLIVISGNLSIVSSITTFKVVIIVAVAALFMNEKDHLREKIIGSLVALAGLLLMK
jgi:drug/metabolite transporter (DMT)-like permease